MTVSQHRVAPADAETRLDRWLRRLAPQLSQGTIQKWCRIGQIRVDGKRVEASSRLLPGQIVRLPPLPDAPPSEPAAPLADPVERRMMERAVLYRDDAILVLNKPPGLPTQGGPSITKHVDGMLDLLRPPGAERPRLVHRLDRDTSGLLLIARTRSVAAHLAALFRTRAVEKTYWAVVVGRPTPMEGVIDQPLLRIGGARGERTALAERDDPEAARAVTAYRTLDHAARKMAWMELQPQTGRTHQLRVHCQAIGTPILGDGKYGGEGAHLAGLSDRLHLHARSLSLPHPEGGQLEVAAPLPPHMTETFDMMGFIAPTPQPPRRR